ncbi:MAG TPA: diguanylate cyclase, partial [Ardenticatenaceae bacterium]|nr:diguanylate cyclase [Ardenticatenaceae bacterium]
RSKILRALVEGMQEPHPISEVLTARLGSSLLRLVDASGAMLSLSGKQLFVGNTPDPAAAASALATLQSCARGDVLAMDDLGVRFPELAACTSEGSGALLLRLATGSEDAVLWFRPEEARTVTWGGDPTEQVNVDPVTNRMSPRASFKAWKDRVRGRSAPWTNIDLGLASELGASIQVESANRTKVALRETQARLGLLAEHSGVVVSLSDLDGTRRYVSLAAERVLGWQSGYLVGRSTLEFVHPGDHKTLLEAIDTMKDTGQSTTTYRFLRPDGSWLWVDSHARLRTAGDGPEPKVYVVVLRDATERKATEMKLLEALDLMEKMATTDSLTGLANRRELDVQTAREWRRCAREHLPLSALLLDADRFKLFNDRYGHLAGDDCLRAIASQLAAVARRPGDIAARFGGEEFVLLMPGTDQTGAVLLAERLRHLIQQLGIAHERNDEFGVVTVSIGVATAWPRDAKSEFKEVEGLYKAADAALYQAKFGGRNQVISH